MNLCVANCLEMFEDKPITFLKHKGRYLSDKEARTALQYALENNIKTIYEIPDEVIDAIVSDDKAYDKYIPKHINYIAVDRVQKVLEYYDFDESDIEKIIKSL